MKTEATEPTSGGSPAATRRSMPRMNASAAARYCSREKRSVTLIGTVEHPGQRDPNESRHDPHAPSPRPVALWDLGRRAIVASPRRGIVLSPAPPRVRPPSPHVERLGSARVFMATPTALRVR